MSDSNDAAEVDVGQRLRSIRLGRRLTLKQVAGLAGITEGFLSQIETGRSAPSLKTFRKIAAALGLDPSDVLDSNDSPLPRLVHATSGRTISIGDVSKFRITPPSMHSLEIIRGELKVGGTTGERYTHGDSDEALVVLTGSVVVNVDETEYELTAGDTVCYRSSMGHQVRNAGDTAATVLWIVSPPSSVTSKR